MASAGKTRGASPERETVAALRADPRADVLIVGGGINGIATFRELALQGISVVLVERGDYASGASSASSHMIHGGVRYLENGEFRLVRESVRERNGLLKTAPHYVRPLETTIPIFSTFSGILSAPFRFLTHEAGKPKERGALLIKVGLTIYDIFSRDGGAVPRHRFRGRKRSLAELPRLNPALKYTATYYDASVHEPERLALDVLLDGLATGAHARAVNYVEAVGASADGVLLRDRETGTEFTVRARVVVNASGPWTDITNEAFGADTSYMGGTKGSHIVLDHPELLAATANREIFFENDDGRIVLIYPLKGRVLVGTTDINADPHDRVVCTEEEIDYFFGLIKHVYPTIVVDRSSIVYTYSGIRPLPRHDDVQPGFVSRDYSIVHTTSQALGVPVLSLVGGKWTTFRALGEHLANETMTELGMTRTTSTVGLAIGGGKNYPRTDKAKAQWLVDHEGELDTDRARVLFDRYGTRAEVVARAITAGEDTAVAGTTLSQREIDYITESEFAVHLGDLVYRRTNLAFVGGLTVQVLEDLADALARSLKWDTVRRDQELASTLADLDTLHGVALIAQTGTR